MGGYNQDGGVINLFRHGGVEGSNVNVWLKQRAALHTVAYKGNDKMSHDSAETERDDGPQHFMWNRRLKTVHICVSPCV